MKTNRVLIKKEVQVIGKKLLIPVWIMAAIYGMIIIGMIVSQFVLYEKVKTDDQSMSLEEALREFLPVDIDKYSEAVSFVFNYVIVFFASGLLLLNLLMVSGNILNVNKRENYELFHRTQPVSIFQISFAKLIGISISNWSVFFGLCLINYLVFNIFFSIQLSGIIPWNFWYGFVGMFYPAIAALVLSIILVAIASLFSAIFQDGALLKAAGIIFGLQIIISIFNHLYKWNVPSPLDYFRSLLRIISLNLGREQIIHFTVPRVFLLEWNTLLHLIAAAGFFIIATYIYGKREVKVV